MYKYLNILVIFNLIFGIVIFTKESNDVEYINFFCTGDNITIVNISCRLISRRHKPRSISVDLDIAKTVDNINVHFEVFKRLNGYKPFVMNYTFDLCEGIKNRGLNPMTRIIKNWVLDNSNLKIPCPIKPQHFKITEFYPDFRIIPSLMPKGRYRADIIMTNKIDLKAILKEQIHFLIKDNF